MTLSYGLGDQHGLYESLRQYSAEKKIRSYIDAETREELYSIDDLELSTPRHSFDAGSMHRSHDQTVTADKRP